MTETPSAHIAQMAAEFADYLDEAVGPAEEPLAALVAVWTGEDLYWYAVRRVRPRDLTEAERKGRLESLGR